MKNKFRVWNKLDRKMYIHNPIDTKRWLIDMNGNLGYMDLESKQWSGILPKDFYEINKYTGLKDKDGKEIYERDLLYIVSLNNQKLEEYITQVKWVDGAFVIKGNEKIDYYDTYLSAYINPTYPVVEIQVVGNIYENKNLLNSKSF